VTPSKNPVSPSDRRAEFVLAGGHTVNQTGLTNKSNRSVFAWDVSRNKSASSSSPRGKDGTNSKNDDSKYVHPADVQYSKNPTQEDSRGFLFSGYHWSPTKAAQLSKPTPFDLDPEENVFASNRAGSSSGSGKKKSAGSPSTSTPKPLSALVSKMGLNNDSAESEEGVRPKQLKTLMDLARERNM
jgi:hypothetical protein